MEIKQSNRSLDSAMIVHEIKRPISAMTMLAQLVVKNIEEGSTSTTDAQLKENLNEIVRQGELCSEILDNMSSFSPREEPRTETVNINNIVSNSLHDIKIQYKEKVREVTFRQQLDKEVPPVQADSKSIYQVLTNLIVNALEALQTSSKKILTVKSSYQEYGFNLEISDTGCGMNNDEKRQIFESFHSTKGRKNKGLGLSICKQIIDQHKGMITVNSEVGEGTTFDIFLPYK